MEIYYPMRRTTRISALSFLTLALAAPLVAQTSTATVNGTIRDSSGSSVPGASVVLRNTATSVELRSASNDSGIYTILNILPGNYTMEVSKSGFRTNKLAPFNLAVNQT